MLPDELRQAANLIRIGRLAQARPILARFVQQHPESEQGWLLLSAALRDPSQRKDCLERVLKINPGNNLAREWLTQIHFAPQPTVHTPGALQEAAPPSPQTGLQKKPIPTPGQLGAETPAPPKLAMPAVAAEARPEPAARLRKTPPSVQAAPAGKPKRRGLGVWIALLGILTIVAVAVAGYVALSLVQTFQATSAALVASTPVGGQVLPPSWTPTLTATATPAPSVTPTPTLTPSPTLVPPNPTMAAMMQRIETEVSDIRGLESKGPLTRYVVSRSAVRPILEGEFLANGGSKEEMEDEARVLSALGLIKPTYDMYTNALNGLTDSLGGFFFPWSDEIYVIGNRFGGVEHFVYSHEFAHALVDQHFEIDAQGVYPECVGNSDRCQAIKALVEGDATLVMGLWWRQYASPSDYQDIQSYVPPQTTLPEQYPPQYALLDGQFPYVVGLDFVASLHDAGNWPEVNKAYVRWPESTEQIMHPAKYRAREKAQEITAPSLDQVLGEGWRRLAEDTLGEWTTYLLLGYGADVDAMLEDSAAAAAASGWGGDRYQVYFQDETERMVLAAVWSWDTASDASQFREAMTDHLGKRFRESVVQAPAGTCWTVNQQTSCLYLAGRQVLWLLAPDMGMVNLLRALYPSF